MAGKAMLVRKLQSRDWAGDARLYRLEPPLRDERSHEHSIYEYVVVSAVTVAYSGPETYVFGVNEQGEVLNRIEQEGSYRGGLDHAEALRRAGYEVEVEDGRYEKRAQ